MSLKYIDHNGASHDIAGLSPGGNIETGAVATREGNLEMTALNAGSNSFSIQFADPMPDADYEISIEAVSGYPTSAGNIEVVPFYNNTKTANGFTMLVFNSTGDTVAAGMTVHWKAFKLYEVADAEALYSEVTDLKTMVPSNASSTNKFATINDLTGETRPLDRRLDDVEDVVPTTASISNKLATAADVAEAMANAGLKVVSTIPTTPQDKDVILYVGATTEDYQKGGIYEYNSSQAAWILISTADVDLSCYETSWTGTTAQWNALSAVDKAKYQLVNITDDAVGQSVTDAVTNGDMRPITSNAVYDLINQITTATVAVTSSAGSGSLIFRRTGKVVSVFGDVTGLDTSATDILICSAPVGYRPTNAYAAALTLSKTPPYTQNGSIWIYQNGDIRVYKTTGQTASYIFITYVTAE